MAVPAIGDRVLLNVAALDRGLGTGGYAWSSRCSTRRPERCPAAAAGRARVKARDRPLQAGYGRRSGQLQGWDDHELLADAESLDAMLVLVAGLHTALALALIATAHDRPGTRVVYVMSDQGALPLAFSRSVATLRDAGLLAATVTVGQAFGGDLEAVTVHSGLLAARLALHADLAIVTQGPGNLGTGTRWGFSGVAVGEAVNAVATGVGGRPVGSLRISDADPRPRHRGLSHHSATAYGRVALAPADLVLPEGAWQRRLGPPRGGEAGRWRRWQPGTGSCRYRTEGTRTRGAARQPGKAVDDGSGPRRRLRGLLPGRGGSRPARRRPAGSMSYWLTDWRRRAGRRPSRWSPSARSTASRCLRDSFRTAG